MHTITAQHTSVQQAGCMTCGHSSEEDQASDTSVSEATTTTAVPAAAGNRLVVPEAPQGADSTHPGGSCYNSMHCSSSRASSVQSADTVAPGAVAAAAAPNAGHPAQQSQQQPDGGVCAAHSTQHVSAVGSSYNGAGTGHLLSSQLAGQQGASAQHNASHQQQPQQHQQSQRELCPPQPQASHQQNKESTDLKVLLARHAALKQYALAGFSAALQQQQQVAGQQARLPPLPTPRQQQRGQPQAQPQQPQQPGPTQMLCLGCSVSPFGRCEVCQLQQQLAAGCLPAAAGHAAHQLQQQLLLLQQHHLQQQQLQHQQEQQRQLEQWQQQRQLQHAAAAAARQQQQPKAKARKQQQQSSAQKEQQQQQQQQHLALLQQQQQHNQQLLLLQHQAQQVYSVPLSSRPWGWWRGPGRCNLLMQLDAVRQPLLDLHTTMGDISSSNALLQAVGGGEQPQQQQQPQQQLAAAGSCSAGVGACWQYLLAQQSQRQQQQQSQQQQQQQQQRRASSQGRAGADSGLGAGAGAAAAAAAAAELQAAEAAASAVKPPKRPWQPKMAPDEPNWDQAAFAGIQARYSQASVAAADADAPQLGKTAQKWPRTQPEHSTATFAQLMLLHGAGWPNHMMWEHWQAAHPPGSLALFVHMKQGVSLAPGMPGRDLIAKTKLKASLDSRWGDISLVEATLASMEEILKRCPHVQHIGLASGHDVPVQLIKPGLLLPGVSLFGLYQFGAPEMETLTEAVVDELLENSSMDKSEADTWGNALSFHHQWMVLSREHAAALVHHRRDIILIGRLLHRACCSVRAGMAPDEFIILTALKQRGFVRSVQRVEVKPHMRYRPGCFLNSYPTFVVFPAESSPHPVLWTHMERRVRCQVEKNTGQQYYTHLSLNDCLDLAVERCAIFFRKIEIRQTQSEDMCMLLSSLEAMWAGQRKGSTAALKSGNSSSTGGNRRKGKRKQSPTPTNDVTPQLWQGTSSSGPASAAAVVSQQELLMLMSAGPDYKKLRESVQAAC